MKTLTRLFPIILSLTLTCCVPSVTTSPLCIAHINARIIATGPACAGLAIQIVSDYFDQERADSVWYNTFSGDSVVYRNVFTVYPSCTDASVQEKLLQLAETGDDFYFIFDSPLHDTTTQFPNCRCQPLPSITLPQKTHRILLTSKDCSDTLVVD
jgi:hypothetical protein